MTFPTPDDDSAHPLGDLFGGDAPPLVAGGQGKSEYQTRRDAAWAAIAFCLALAAVWAWAVLG